MKKLLLLLLTVSLPVACGRTDSTRENAVQSTTTTAGTTETTADTTTASATAAKKNCRSLVKSDQLGKANVYQESAKPLQVTITVDQDTSSLQTDDGCFFNNTTTILAVKKSGSRVFKRTLLKDDLLYFTKSDAFIEQAILQDVRYKPTFNGQKYVTLTMRLMKPDGRKTVDYTVYMNYFGEMLKVR